MKDLTWPARRQTAAADDCCTGACLQGHACPRYRYAPEPLTCRLRFIVGLLFAGFIWVVTR